MSLKVLVVEDEGGLMELMQGILELKCGYETFATGDGEEAVKLYIEHKPDICILDIQLDESKLSGIDVLREVKKIEPKAKCIMMTRITEQDAIKQSKALGASAYLLKPLDTMEWIGVVREIAQEGGL